MWQSDRETVVVGGKVVPEEFGKYFQACVLAPAAFHAARHEPEDIVKFEVERILPEADIRELEELLQESDVQGEEYRVTEFDKPTLESTERDVRVALMRMGFRGEDLTACMDRLKSFRTVYVDRKTREVFTP